ncbi:MAG: hypothetical protein N2254_09930, partial [bacterium]|nr:hypothetical protein [bacterium]
AVYSNSPLTNAVDPRWFGTDTVANSGTFRVRFDGNGTSIARVPPATTVPAPLQANAQNEIMTSSDESYCVRLEVVAFQESGTDPVTVGLINASGTVIHGIRFQVSAGQYQIVPIRNGTALSPINFTFSSNINDFWLIVRKADSSLGTSHYYQIIRCERQANLNEIGRTSLILDTTTAITTKASLRLGVVSQGTSCVSLDYIRLIEGDDIELV